MRAGFRDNGSRVREDLRYTADVSHESQTLLISAAVRVLSAHISSGRKLKSMVECESCSTGTRPASSGPVSAGHQPLAGAGLDAYDSRPRGLEPTAATGQPESIHNVPGQPVPESRTYGGSTRSSSQHRLRCRVRLRRPVGRLPPCGEPRGTDLIRLYRESELLASRRPSSGMSPSRSGRLSA